MNDGEKPYPANRRFKRRNKESIAQFKIERDIRKYGLRKKNDQQEKEEK